MPNLTRQSEDLFSDLVTLELWDDIGEWFKSDPEFVLEHLAAHA